MAVAVDGVHDGFGAVLDGVAAGLEYVPVAGDVAGGAGDRVFTAFGETEQAEALAELPNLVFLYLHANPLQSLDGLG